jgi:hypothetical protein
MLLRRLLLDSRVMDVPMAYKATFVMLSSLKPFVFNSHKNEERQYRKSHPVPVA